MTLTFQVLAKDVPLVTMVMIDVEMLESTSTYTKEGGNNNVSSKYTIEGESNYLSTYANEGGNNNYIRPSTLNEIETK